MNLYFLVHFWLNNVCGKDRKHEHFLILLFMSTLMLQSIEIYGQIKIINDAISVQVLKYVSNISRSELGRFEPVN